MENSRYKSLKNNIKNIQHIFKSKLPSQPEHFTHGNMQQGQNLLCKYKKKETSYSKTLNTINSNISRFLLIQYGECYVHTEIVLVGITSCTFEVTDNELGSFISDSKIPHKHSATAGSTKSEHDVCEEVSDKLQGSPPVKISRFVSPLFGSIALSFRVFLIRFSVNKTILSKPFPASTKLPETDSQAASEVMLQCELLEQ